MGPLIISKAVQGPMGSRGSFMGPKEVKRGPGGPRGQEGCLGDPMWSSGCF